MALAGQVQTGYTTYAVTGPWYSPLFGSAYQAGGRPEAVATDWAGNIYLALAGAISKIDAHGSIAPVTGYGPAVAAPGQPVYALLAGTEYYGLAGDAQGNLFIAAGTAIYRAGPDGLIEYYSALAAGAVACDAAGNLYAVVNGSQVVRVGSDGAASPVAGTGVAGYTGDGGPAAAAQIHATQLAADAAGNLWLGDVADNVIRKVDLTGTITTVAQVPYLTAIAAANGAVYFTAYGNGGVTNPNQVMKVDAAGGVETVAGVPYSAPYNGDGGPAVAAAFGDILSLAADGNGDVYIVDGARLRRVDAAGVVHTVVGCECAGDGGPAAWADVSTPVGIAADAAGNIYVSDQASHTVRRIALDGTISTVAGTGEAGFSGDGGPAVAARLAWPSGLAFDSAGNLYIADEQNNRIREVTTGGTIQTVAGNGVAGFAGDGGPATAASLALPDGVAVDADGNLYIADTASHRIRRVGGDGVIQTIAGSDQYGTSGDGGPAAQALLINPRSLAFDQSGNLVLTDSAARVVRRITPAGIIERVAGTGQDGTGGYGGPAVAAQLDLPWGVAVDSAGNVLIADGFMVRSVDAAGVIQLVGYDTEIRGLALDPAGDIWVAGGGVEVLSRGGPPWTPPPVVFNQQIGNAALAGIDFPVYPSAAVAPGEIVTIAGSRLGSNAQVWFDGVAAPVLSANAGHVTAVVPYEVSGKTMVGVTAEVNGVASNVAMVGVLPAVPELFTYSLGILISAAALNQDGTRNGPGNPAPVGSVVSLYATGAGNMTPAEADGAVIGGPLLPVPALPVSVTMGTRSLAILYAGAAPGLVAGALQVNVAIPTDLVPAPVANVMDYYLTELRVGNGQSMAAYVWVKP